MTHTNKNENLSGRPDLNALFLAKIKAVASGDLEALHDISNKIFFARLDPADPEYEEKLARHEKNEREYRAERWAQRVIGKSGKPLDFWDSLSAIDDAVDQAVDVFERYPCPQHAADLLGLIECRNLLMDAHMETDICPAEEEPD